MEKNKRGRPSKNHGQKKNPVQLNAYKSFLSDPQNQPEDTVDVCNQNLTGTNVLQDHEVSTSRNEKPLPPPIKVRIKRFFESYGVWGIIITALLSFGVWTVTSIHQNDLAIERLTVKLDYVEKAFDSLDTDTINTQELNKEIEELRDALKSSWQIDIKDIENRITLIEWMIETLKPQTE